MPAISSTFPGKIILFGEHAVVYGSHAIAIPVNQVSSKVVITPLINSVPGIVEVTAADIHLHAQLDSLPEQDPIAFCIRSALQKLGVQKCPAFSIRINSTIPIAAGMGSGASISCAIAQAVSTFLGKPFTNSEISSIAFEVEKLHHGNPSGIDNTVIAFKQAVYYKREEEPELLKIGARLVFIIADSGIKSLTSDVVNAVRDSWKLDQAHYNSIFSAIDTLVQEAFTEIKTGNRENIGALMNKNHLLLQEMGVSHPLLDELVTTARINGAYGAKLSGAGRGGNIIALIPPETFDPMRDALLNAGATRVILTTLDQV